MRHDQNHHYTSVAWLPSTAPWSNPTTPGSYPLELHFSCSLNLPKHAPKHIQNHEQPFKKLFRSIHMFLNKYKQWLNNSFHIYVNSLILSKVADLSGRQYFNFFLILSKVADLLGRQYLTIHKWLSQLHVIKYFTELCIFKGSKALPLRNVWMYMRCEMKFDNHKPKLKDKKS